MPSNKPKIVIYSSDDIKKKLEFIADENNRSASAEAELLIKKHIKRYEEDNGTIQLDK